MIYVETNSTNVFYNFALEYYLLTKKGLSENVFMFWRTTPTLMTGNFQNIYAEINVEYARKKGITVVRRKSGGGTIYTDEGGWQYSYIMPNLRHEEIDFKQNSQAVVNALNALGAPAAFNDRNDILIEGKKVSGTARYVSNGGIVHHGSLLYNTNIEEMVRSLTVADDKMIAKGIQSVRQRVTNIREHVKKPVTPEEFKKQMLSAVLGESYQEYVLLSKEQEAVLALQKEMFESWDWNWGQNPALSITRFRRFAGGRVELAMDARHGRIEKLHFTGDFFFEGDLQALENAFAGCRLHKQDVLAVLARQQAEGHFFRITNGELAALLLGVEEV